MLSVCFQACPDRPSIHVYITFESGIYPDVDLGSWYERYQEPVVSTDGKVILHIQDESQQVRPLQIKYHSRSESIVDELISKSFKELHVSKRLISAFKEWASQ
jgi:hypothetical protein